MTNDEPNGKRIYDLEDRTAKFGEQIIVFARKLPKDVITTPIISQLIRSATSVGANYAEADDAQSKNDFRHKVAIVKKEARETKHWLRMLTTALPEHKVEINNLWREANELHLIFAAIIRSSLVNRNS